MSRLLPITLLLQGVFYILTGLWPFVHLESFVAAAGPKPDIFQLHVTSALIVAIGVVLLVGSQRPGRSVVWLGILAALVFAGLDVAYAPRLPDTYWLDAAAEVTLAILVVLGARSWAPRGRGVQR